MQSNNTVVRPGSVSSLSSQLAAATTTHSLPEDANGSISSSKIMPDNIGVGTNGLPAKDSGDNAVNTSAEAPTQATAATGQLGSAPANPPYTPCRLNFSNRLALQMPSRGPLSPVLDPALGYSIARRPRLDFARSCTSLHHSTLAEASPDSSPLASNSGHPIPRVNHRPLESPISNNALAGSSHASSFGSASMLDYAPSGDDSDSTSDEDLDGDFHVMDAVAPTNNAPNPAPTHIESAASISLRNHQKARFGARQLRKPNNNNRNRTMMSPSPIMQPISHASMMGAGFDYSIRRRDSLTLGPSALEYEPDHPDPVRRPVSRRGSLLPKTKNFQRIKAALIEESSPVDVEVKREAEITRQIREEDEPHLSPQHSQGENRSMEAELNSILDDQGIESGDNTSQMGSRGIGISFSKQAERHGGFWFGDQMEGINGSPPAYPGSRAGSDGDIVMNSDSSCLTSPSSIPSDMRRLKRRRVDDERFEQPNVFKRRAVSPGLSNSPKLAQSPPMAGTGKRLNFQGLNDTHDGLMKMSLQ